MYEAGFVPAFLFRLYRDCRAVHTLDCDSVRRKTNMNTNVVQVLISLKLVVH